MIRTVSGSVIRSVALLCAGSLAVLSQPAQGPRSPEVHSDKRVTFRFQAPNAKEVLLSREGAANVPMQKNEQGVWELTTAALEPDLYGYTFVADGVRLLDPANSMLKPNLLNLSSMVHVPGESLPWEITDAPRGQVHHHFYKSGVVGDHRDYFVYTPAGYDSSARKSYPGFYLLHGFSDDASGWTSVGRAHVILDNLIAQGKAKPMIVVMPLGYGAPQILSRGPGPRNMDLWRQNVTKFRDALLTEVIPQVEKAYRTETGRNSRAIAGLSMGGAESLFTGLNALDKFAWIGSFSAGGLGENFDETFPNLDQKANKQLNLLWVACGVDDRLIEANRKFLGFLDSKGVQYTKLETPGAHTWMVWRRNLATFAPMLFQSGAVQRSQR